MMKIIAIANEVSSLKGMSFDGEMLTSTSAELGRGHSIIIFYSTTVVHCRNFFFDLYHT